MMFIYSPWLPHISAKYENALSEYYMLQNPWQIPVLYDKGTQILIILFKTIEGIQRFFSNSLCYLLIQKIKNIFVFYSISVTICLSSYKKKLSANVVFCVLWCGPCILEPQIGEFLEHANFKILFFLCCLALWRSPSNPTVIFQLNDSASKVFQSTILCWYIFHTNQGYIDRFAVQNLMDFFSGSVCMT